MKREGTEEEREQENVNQKPRNRTPSRRRLGEQGENLPHFRNKI